MRRQVCITVLLLLSFAHGAAADAPRQISHQGVLLDSNRVIVPNGLYTIDFEIFPAPSGGSYLFRQSIQVNVVDGVYNVLLSDTGGGTQNFATTFAHTDTYLQLTISAGPSGFPVPQTLTPRQKFASVPYALTTPGIAFATDSENFIRTDIPENTTRNISEVTSTLTIPAVNGVVRANGRISLQRQSANCANNWGQCTAKVTLQYTRNGGALNACRSAEVQSHDKDLTEPETMSISLDCVIQNPIAGDVYAFSFGVTTRDLGNWSYGDTHASPSADDMTYIDAFWYPLR